MQPNETNFPPLTMLPMLSYAVAGALDAAKEQLTNLLQIEKKPHILDDETVTRVIRVHTEQIQTIADERVLCAHWRKQKLTVAQTHMIDKIELTLAELEKTNQRILFLATHYKDHTIDKILDMPDEELGLEYLMGKLPDSKDAENNHKKGEASTTSFSLPPEVKCYRKKISNNGFSYKFRHAKWGELGRIDVIPHGNQSQISAYAVAGDPRDPNTELRNSLFRVLAMEFNQILTQKHGEGISIAPPEINLIRDTQLIASKAMVCLTCGKPVALLIFAEDADTSDKLEDYARMMYSKTVEINLPTWIIGAEEEVTPDKEGLALILKTWPKRGLAKKISSLVFEPMLSRLQSTHCD